MVLWMVDRGFRALLSAAALGLVVVSNPATAQQDEPVAAMIAQPTPEHERLKQGVGVWDATVKMYTAGPNADPMVSTAVETNRMMGDLWLISDFKGDLGGLPYSGHGQTGYDPRSGKYVSTWIDSMSTSIMSSEGTYDETTRELTMIGEVYDPSIDAMARQKTVLTQEDRNTRAFTMFMKAPPYGDDWVKVMEISFQRRSDSE